MAAVAEVTWPALQRAALDAADPGWFAAFDRELLERARTCLEGRRLLARILAQAPAPALFGSVPMVVPGALGRQTWLLWNRERIEALTLDIGALALSRVIRRTVERDAVLRWRRVLGERRYALALRCASDHGAPIDAASLPADDDALLRGAVFTAGDDACHGWARSIHPAAAERWQLTMAPSRVRGGAAPLPHALIEAHVENNPVSIEDEVTAHG